MATRDAHATENMNRMIKRSNTGHAESPAKAAPMSSKLTSLIGAEQTSDGAKAEGRQLASHAKRTKGRSTELQSKGNRQLS